MQPSVPSLSAPASETSLLRKLTWWVLVLPAIMVAAIIGNNLYWLNFSHVMSGVLWTGTDIFMGFFVGPIMRKLDPQQRRAFINWLTPKTMLYLPILAATTGTAGWTMANRLGMMMPQSPDRPWILLALGVIAVLTLQGFGILLPNSIRTYRELQKSRPDVDKIFRLNRRTNRLAGIQGIFQVAIILIMARLVMG